ncbi:hypothetical protein N431DRAFT_456732 [Stipitochalara longipes BDJ]|nr:hypothetical protein N431DRAFT_456732 [Stipitochalara longipes BDJ]
MSNTAADTRFPRSQGRWSKEREIRPINEYLSELTPKTTVKLLLGLKQPIKTWTLPEKLLCDHSSYFRAAFQGNFKESVSKRICLDDEIFSEKAVAHLVDWMYTGKLECREDHDCQEPCSTHDTSWYSLYMLGDMLDIAGLANAVLNQIHECLDDGDWLPSPKDINYIYTKTGYNSTLREIVVPPMVDAFLQRTSEGFAKRSGDWSKVLAADLVFASEVMTAIKKHVDTVECDKGVLCRFHFTHKPARKRRRMIR